MPETPPGQQKMHTITRTNPTTGEKESKEITQEEWKTDGKTLKADGWTREDETEEPVTP